MDDNVHIDYQSIIQMAVDKAIVEFVSSLMPDEETRKVMLAMTKAHRKYGVDAATSLKIVQEFAELIKEENDDLQTGI